MANFSHTAHVAGRWRTFDFYNGTITGLRGLRRLGSNYLEAKQAEPLRLRLGLEAGGLNVSITVRITALFRYIYAQVDVFILKTSFVAEVQE